MTTPRLLQQRSCEERVAVRNEGLACLETQVEEREAALPLQESVREIFKTYGITLTASAENREVKLLWPIFNFRPSKLSFGLCLVVVFEESVFKYVSEFFHKELVGCCVHVHLIEEVANA